MGRLIILGGNARSGKSTLAFKLVKNGFSRISLDNLQQYLEDGLNFDFEKVPKEKRLNFFKVIVDKGLEEVQNEDTNIVIDMFDYLPEDLENFNGLNKGDIYFLIYPNCSKEEIKYNVVHYAKPTDWIAQVNEQYLEQCVDNFYTRNKVVLKQCEKYGYQYVDTKSGKDRDFVLENLLYHIING